MSAPLAPPHRPAHLRRPQAIQSERATPRSHRQILIMTDEDRKAHAVVSLNGKRTLKIRTDLPTKRIAGVLICPCGGHLVVLHGFIGKTRATPDEDLALARKRRNELER